MSFRSVRIALMVAGVAAALAVPAFAQDGAKPGKPGEPIKGPIGAPVPVPVPAPAHGPAVAPAGDCGPTMQTICVTECVPETYKVKHVTYKQVCKTECYTAYKCECVPEACTRTVVTYKQVAEVHNVTRNYCVSVPVCEERTVMQPHYTCVPVTKIVSVNLTVTSMTAPALYEPLALVEETVATAGAVVSMTRSLLAPSEPAAPGDASVRTAAFPAPSAIVPPLSASAEVDV